MDENVTTVDCFKFTAKMSCLKISSKIPDYSLKLLNCRSSTTVALFERRKKKIQAHKINNITHYALAQCNSLKIRWKTFLTGYKLVLMSVIRFNNQPKSKLLKLEQSFKTNKKRRHETILIF